MNTISKPFTPHPYVFAGLSSASSLYESNSLINAICEHLKIDVASLQKSNRKNQVRARFYFCYIHKHFIRRISDTKVMEFLGRDRTTFYHNINQLQNDIDTNPDIKTDFESFLKSYNPIWADEFQQLSTQR